MPSDTEGLGAEWWISRSADWPLGPASYYLSQIALSLGARWIQGSLLRMRTGHAVPFLVAGLLTGLLTGCGQGNVPVAQGSAPPSVSESSSDSGSASPSESASASADGGAKAITPEKLDAAELVNRVNKAALAKQTAVVSADSGAQGSMKGVAHYGKNLEMSMTMVSSGQTMKIVMLGNATYLDMGQPVNGKHWLKIDSKSQDPTMKLLSSVMSSAKQQSGLPQAPAAFKGVPTTSSAGEDVAGVPTVAYTMKLNSKQIIAALPADMRKLVGSTLAGATAETTYYVGADWLPRKVVTKSTVQGKVTNSAITYDKWGEPVTIKAPAASDITTSLAG